MTGENSSLVFKLLVSEQRTMSFEGQPDKKAAGAVDNEVDFGEDGSSRSFLQNDSSSPKLNTLLTESRLARHLTKIHRDQLEMLEERGINALFIALGMLEWREADHSKEVRLAPLVLVPVSVNRTSRGGFSMTWNGNEIGTNLSMSALLKSEFSIDLPLVSGDELDLDRYFSQVSSAVSHHQDWRVHSNKIALSFFSFAKYMIYKDLSPESWPNPNNILEHDVLLGLFKEREFEEVEGALTDQDDLDPHWPIGQTNEIFDADASQTLALIQAQSGKSMVIEGPPGTGKSQTIANLIADFVAKGKKVLFVSEKAAALTVVHDFLREANLHQCSIELHGTKSNKRAFYSDLQDTLGHYPLGIPSAEEAINVLNRNRASLNAYVKALHTPIGCSSIGKDALPNGRTNSAPSEYGRGITPRRAIGRLIELGPEPDTEGRMTFSQMSGWTQSDFEARAELVASLETQIKKIGTPARHAFAGSKQIYIMPDDKRELKRQIAQALELFERFQSAVTSLSDRLHFNTVEGAANLNEIDRAVEFIASAPEISGVDFNNPLWQTNPGSIKIALDSAILEKKVKEKYRDKIKPDSWNCDTRGFEYGILPPSKSICDIADLTEYLSALDKLGATLSEVNKLSTQIASLLGVSLPNCFWNQESLVIIAKRLSLAPNLKGLLVTSEKWHKDRSIIREGLSLIRQSQETRTKWQKVIQPFAWEVEVDPLLEILEKESKSTLGLWHSRSYRRAFGSAVKALGLSVKPSIDALMEMLSIVSAERKVALRIEAIRPVLTELFSDRLVESGTDVEELTDCLNFLCLLHNDIAIGKLEKGVATALLRQASLQGIEMAADGLLYAIKGAEAVMKDLFVIIGRIDGGEFESGTGDAKERLYRQMIDSIEPAIAKIDKLFVFEGAERTLFERLEIIGAIRDYQLAREKFESGRSDLASCIGFRRLELPVWEDLKVLVTWIMDMFHEVSVGALHSGILRFFSNGDNSLGLREQLLALYSARELYKDLIEKICETMKLDVTAESFITQSVQIQGARLKAWGNNVDDLESYFKYNQIVQRILEFGMTEVVSLAETWGPASERLLSCFSRTWYNGLLGEAMRSRAVLQDFDRFTHEEIVKSFRFLDEKLIEINRARVGFAHYKSVPKGTGAGEMGFLMIQINKQRGQVSIRKAMENAFSAIQEIKPVFLMSPMSVAMYLPPGGPSFDVVIFDEASQIKPEDALGSVVRAKQMIVVGDSRQMPPTSFFDKIVVTEDEEDNGEAEDLLERGLRDQESILALATASIVDGSSNRRDLRWHYRSRHQSLIATSNKLFYKSRLVVFPHSQCPQSESGLVFRYLQGTVYDRGGSKRNNLEAKAVVEEVVAHVLKFPDRSVGIVSFSKAQQEAIQDCLDLARRNEPALREFDDLHKFDRLFVKNLETVQGDERDVIFISVGYGLDENRYFAMNFGPLSHEGGERRLNVLITRSRFQTVVFANFRAADMRMAGCKSEGVRALHTFLDFAECGHLDATRSNLALEPSYFENCVRKALLNRGYDVDQQVGSEHFYIDLAVRNPDEPGRYAIGIECDGRMYHSARSARDRDRLRQQVLEDRGWIIHRIWSTDWWHHPERELERCLAAIEQSFTIRSNILLAEPTQVESVQLEQDAEEFNEDKGATLQVEQVQESDVYVMAKLSWPMGCELLDMPVRQLAALVGEVAKTEAPVHVDEIIRRIRDAAGKGRAGSKIREHIGQAIRTAERNKFVTYKKPFVYLPDVATFKIRSRINMPQQTKSIEMIAPEEIELTVEDILRSAVAAFIGEISRPVAKRLGIERMTPETDSHINRVIGRAVKEGRFDELNGKLKLKN